MSEGRGWRGQKRRVFNGHSSFSLHPSPSFPDSRCLLEHIQQLCAGKCMAYILTPGRPKSNMVLWWTPDESGFHWSQSKSQGEAQGVAGCKVRAQGRLWPRVRNGTNWGRLSCNPARNPLGMWDFIGYTINIHQLIWDFMTVFFNGDMI